MDTSGSSSSPPCRRRARSSWHRSSWSWSEATSVLHELAWRGRLPPEDAALAHAAVGSLPVARRQRRNLRARAWAIADGLGRAKTYDAEYCALAELLGCPLVTADGGLRASAGRVLDVLTPREAAARLLPPCGTRP